MFSYRSYEKMKDPTKYQHLAEWFQSMCPFDMTADCKRKYGKSLFWDIDRLDHPTIETYATMFTPYVWDSMIFKDDIESVAETVFNEFDGNHIEQMLNAYRKDGGTNDTLDYGQN